MVNCICRWLLIWFQTKVALLEPVKPLHGVPIQISELSLLLQSFKLMFEKVDRTSLNISANKVCCHTLLNTLSNELFDVYFSYKEAKEIWESLVLKYTIKSVLRQFFIIDNYYHWTMIEDKDIKVLINKYHKLLEDL
ncbi:hypothetical protein JHK85_040780 [Glycine max]|nr:hypothetical protein JHK87_040007 [Glycine soja]KAG4963326.1 hypothetical protein JHK86_040194 [Glycine max]KAG4965805.1 hypothetical protein JHK85_040780 [Glycine max]